MSTTVPEPEILGKAVALACRAPSLHNSQPWKWVVDAAALHLYADPARLVHSADSSGREMILSCGAVLDHLRVALAAAGWNAAPHRLPDPAEPDHLATCVCGPMPAVDDADRERAKAIDRRRTDRLPFAAPRGWEKLEAALRRLAERDDVMFDVVSDDARPQLAEASGLTEALRRQDPTYQSELRWWTSPFESDQGVPQTSRVSSSEAGRVDVARAFPTTGYGERRT
ncbi:MAG: NAD(P)H nitroreductase, partial [Mycolicibacterium sp.]|nr:NAD(P)H nitroreductase [Mycolicibacterium sp.]